MKYLTVWAVVLLLGACGNLGVKPWQRDVMARPDMQLGSAGLLRRNTTLSVGWSSEFDAIDPVGGVPVPMASTDGSPRDGTLEKRQVHDLLLGVTQILDRDTLFQFNYGVGSSSGYANDPCKFVSVVDAASGETVDYLYEERPDSRFRQTLFGRVKYNLTGDVADVSYRYLNDDWDVSSHTLEMTYRFNLHDGMFLEPHLRLYRQEAAGFYRHSLVAGEPIPREVSADYRLASFDATTIGMQFGVNVKESQRWSVRAEYYQQRGDTRPADAIGVQRDFDLFPELEAVSIVGTYSLIW